MDPSLHVILGAGQIGTRIARLLVDRGDRVRLVARNPRHLAGAEMMTGDVRDLDFATRATAGARIVFDTTNPPYPAWKRELLPLGAGALHGATRANAKLVALDNLYMYGAPTGPMRETSPLAPCSRKGQLRAELSELRLAAHRRGDVQVAIGRASDFFGPALPYSWWSERCFRRILAGKPAECMGDPDQPHSYNYADDVARGLLALADADDATGVWHLPVLPAESTRALGERIARALATPIAFTTMSPLVLHAVGVFARFMGELPELAYQWKLPFVLDDSKFRARFELRPTPIDEQVATTVAWAYDKLVAQRAA